LEHFKKLQGNLELHQNKCHSGGVPDMRKQCAKAADQSAQGVANGQTAWAAGPTLQPFMGWLRGDTLQEAVDVNPKLKVGAGQTPWPAGHVATPASHHMV
jgi:hypothetical protein